MPLLSPVTDNCPSWISGRVRMVVEIFSWPNLKRRMCPDRGSNQWLLDSQSDSLLTTLVARQRKIDEETCGCCIRRPWEDPKASELRFSLSQCQIPKIGECHATHYSFSHILSLIWNLIPNYTAEIDFLPEQGRRFLTVTLEENGFWLCNQSGFEYVSFQQETGQRVVWHSPT